MKLRPTIIIDRREKRPWKFEILASEPGTLPVGEYAPRGLEHVAAIERKSAADWVQCVGGRRQEFKNQLVRLAGLRFRLVCIEATAAEIEAGNWPGKIRPNHVLGSLAAWLCQFGVGVWLGGSPSACARYAERWLYQACRTVWNESQAARAVLEGMEAVA